MTTELTQKKIFKFWSPLAATWLMMAFEGPFLAALIARLPNEKFNLAAYGIAYAFALLSEAPVIMMMAASTALVKDRHSYYKMRNFSNLLIVFVTVTLLVALIPPVFDFLTLQLINLPKDVSALTYTSMLFLLPWPGAIGYRRFLQGILIVNNRTRMVSYGTVIRVLMMSGSAYFLYRFSGWPGAYVGSFALSAGVFSEMIASHFMCRKLIKEIKQQEPESDIENNLNYKKIYSFYYPLALATFVGLGAHPIITFFVGHSRLALESLAVLPVINSLVFIFRAIGLSYHEVGIALMGKNMQGFAALKKFATRLALINVSVLAIIAFTPFVDIWFGSISGLSPLLSSIAVLPTRILVLIPALTVLISFQRAIQVVSKKTSAVSNSTIVEVTGIFTVLFIGINILDIVGATAAALALLIGRIAANAYLLKTNSIALKKVNSPAEVK